MRAWRFQVFLRHRADATGPPYPAHPAYASLLADVLVPAKHAARARTHQVDPSVAVDVGADAAVHRGFVFDPPIQPLAGRGIGGREKHVDAWRGTRVLRRDAG